jgi:acyl-CoA reductase-like NAD-dependent aldehyde dehydrogenase
VLPLLELVRAFCARGPEMLATRRLRVRVAPHKRNSVHYLPRGVIALIAPFNFPLAIGCGEALLALLAGNAVVLKPSEHTPLVTQRFVALWLELGLDPHLFEIVPGGVATGEALVSAGVDYVSFTGSDAGGRAVGQACAAQPVPFRLELGGKADVIVRDDADLDRAALALTWGAFANGGQVCAGVQRVFAHHTIAADLARRMAQEAAQLVTGDPREPGCDLGYLCHPRLPRLVAEVVDDAVQGGARLMHDGGAAEADGRARPTILFGASPASKILSAECFGPVVAVVPTASDDDAVVRANHAPGDLCAYVFTEDRDAAARLAPRLRAGTVMVNDVVWSYGMPEAPWAAVSRSGVGVSHGPDGLRAFCAPQHVVEERVRVMTREPFWYPYSKARVAQLRRGLEALYAPDVLGKARGLLGRGRR